LLRFHVGVIVGVKVTIVLMIIAIGWHFINPANHTPFVLAQDSLHEGMFKHGWGGVLGGAGVQVWKDEERAGKGIMTIVTPVLKVEEARLAGLGLKLLNKAEGNFGAVAQIFDAEGNRINLVEPPKGFVNH